MAGPLAGFKVVEMVGLGPGPFCAMMLADMGADVIRIDRPRPAGTPPPTAAIGDARHDILARGRRTLDIDLRADGAAEAMLQLIGRADALIEGFRPGVMERLGLGPEVCLARHPKLVYGRVTGWGRDGPLSPSAGHDINYIALTGVLHAIGHAGDAPVVPLNYIGDFGGGGMFLAFGIVCALLEARGSGRGQVVDAAMTDGSAMLSAMMYAFRADGQVDNRRETNLLDGGAPFYATYTCADGKYLAVGAIEPQFYRRLLEGCGLAGDPTFAAQMDRGQWPLQKARLAAVLASRTREAWCERFAGSDACVAPVLDWDEAPLHAHNVARATFVDVDGVFQPAPAPRFSRSAPARPRPPDAVPAGGAEILREWGVAAPLIDRLAAAGALGGAAER